MGMRIFWFLLALFVPKFINDAVYPFFNNYNTGLSLTRAMLGAIPAAIASVFFLYKAFPEIFSSKHIKCPDCREKILKDARVCKHCGYRFPAHSQDKNILQEGLKGVFHRFQKLTKDENLPFYVFFAIFAVFIITALIVRYINGEL